MDGWMDGWMVSGRESCTKGTIGRSQCRWECM